MFELNIVTAPRPAPPPRKQAKQVHAPIPEAAAEEETTPLASAAPAAPATPEEVPSNALVAASLPVARKRKAAQPAEPAPPASASSAPPKKKGRYANKAPPPSGEAPSLLRKEDPSKAAKLPSTLPLSEGGTKAGGGAFSATTFDALELDQYLQRHLTQRVGVSLLTPVQQHAIPHLLAGGDMLVRSPTGSGKTLAYAVPLVQALVARGPAVVRRSAGTFAIVLVPTRELCLQTHEIIERLTNPFPWLVTSCLMGGERRKAEKARLRKGVALLVGTPGRVSDHCEATNAWRLDDCAHLVLDEADRLLDLGFQQSLNAIIDTLERVRASAIEAAAAHGGARLTHHRQTVLLSATLSKGLHELAGRSLTDHATLHVSPSGATLTPSTGSAGSSLVALSAPVTVPLEGDLLAPSVSLPPANVEAASTMGATDAVDGERLDAPSGLQQSYVLVPTKQRLTALLSLIRSRCCAAPATSGGSAAPDCKMIVFVSSCDGVDFLYELLAAGGDWPGLREAAIAAGHAPTDALADEEEIAHAGIDRGRTIDAGGPDYDEDQAAEGTAFEQEGWSSAMRTDAPEPKPMASQRRGGDGLSFPCSLVGTTVLRLHGKMSQRDRTQAFVRFRQLRAGVMLATDVAARGLNLEGVHWIVQHDLPQDAKEYLHRAGRTARLGQRGQAVLMLHPTERPFLNLLREASVVPKEIKFASLQAALCPDGGKKDVYLVEVALQKQLEAAVSDGAFLHVAAGTAYQSYLRGYAAHSKVVRRLVHVGQLHLGHLAKSFGLKDIPSKLTQQQLKRHATARAAAKGGTEYLAGAEYVPRQQRQEGGGADGKKKKRKGGGTQLNERMRQQKHARPVGSAALVSEFG